MAVIEIQKYRTLTVRTLAASFIAALASCGGGGGGDGSSPGTGAPGGGSTTARTGAMTYSFIDKIYSVNMAANQARTVLQQNYNESYVGAGMGPEGVIAVAYNSSSTGPTSRLTLLKPDGATEVSTRYDFTIQGSPRLSADGSKLAFTVGVYSGSTLTYSVQVVGRDGSALYFFRNRSRPAWLPDGRLVVYDLADRNLYLTGADFNAAPTVVPNSADALSHSISPDGASIVFTRKGQADGRRHVFVMGIDGSGTKQVTTSSGGEETWATFSPDGKELMILSAGCVTVGGGGIGAGSVDDDLIHIIPANAQMLEIDRDRTTAPTRLLGEGDQANIGRCTNAAPSWR